MSNNTSNHTERRCTTRSVLLRTTAALAVILMMVTASATPALAQDETTPIPTADEGESLSSSDFCTGGLGQIIGFFVTFLTIGGVLMIYLLLKADGVMAALSGSQQGYAKAKQRAAFRVRGLVLLLGIDFAYLFLSYFTPLPGFGCAITSILNVGL